MKYIYKIILVIIFLLFYLNRTIIIYSYDDSTYFTTWSSAMHSTAFQNPKYLSQKLRHNSLRQIIRVSSEGEKIRIKFSNMLGENILEIKQVSIADIISNSKVDLSTMKYLTFNGKKSVVIRKGEEIYSDTFFYPLKALSQIAITMFLGSVPKKLTCHDYSTYYSYIEKGNKINKKVFSDKNKIAHWFFISAIEINSEHPKKTMVFFGNSITDGVIFRDDIRDNYPDILYENLYQRNQTSNISVANQGINANKLAVEGLPRFEHDILNIKGIKYIFSLFGVNDINVINAPSKKIIDGYKQIIKRAHERNILIYAGTIMPFANYKCRYLWNEKKEKVRNEVNNWIRKTKPEDGGFDDFIDFDNLLKDPENETIMYKEYDSGDGIHPGFEGLKKMASGILDLSLFINNS